MADTYYRLSSLTPANALSRLSYAAARSGVDQACLRDLWLTPGTSPTGATRVDLIIPLGKGEARKPRQAFVDALKSAPGPTVAPVVGDGPGPSSLGWPSYLGYLLLHSGEATRAVAEKDDNHYLIVGRAMTAAWAEAIFHTLAFDATEVEVAALANSQGEPLYLFLAAVDPARGATFRGALAAQQLSNGIVLQAFPAEPSVIYLPGDFPTGPTPEALAGMGQILSLMLATDDATSNRPRPRGLAIVPAPTSTPESVQYELIELDNLAFDPTLELTGGLALNVGFALADLESSPQHATQLAEQIRQVRPPAGYTLTLVPSKAGDPLDRTLDELRQEQLNLQEALEDVRYDLDHYELLRRPRLQLLRFRHEQLRLFAEVLADFPMATLRSGALRYAFQMTPTNPAGVHYLLIDPSQAGVDHLDRLFLWDTPTRPLRFWLDPHWARHYFTAGNQHSVFVPQGRSLFPPVHVWDHTQMDRRLLDALRIYLDQAYTGPTRPPELPLYVCEPGDGIDQLLITVLDQTKFLPLVTQIGWLNDNLLVLESLGTERLVQLAAENLLAETIDKELMPRAAEAQRHVSEAAEAARVDNQRLVDNLLQQVTAEIDTQLRQLRDQIKTTRQQIQAQTKQIDAAGEAIKTRRQELEGLLKRLTASQVAYGEMNGVASDLGEAMNQLDQELHQARERTQVLEQHVKDAEAARRQAQADLTGTLEALRRERQDLERRLAEL